MNNVEIFLTILIAIALIGSVIVNSIDFNKWKNTPSSH